MIEFNRLRRTVIPTIKEYAVLTALTVFAAVIYNGLLVLCIFVVKKI